MSTVTNNELAKINNYLTAAKDSGQPVNLILSVGVFNAIMDYRTQQAIDAYKEEQERIAKENEQGDLVGSKEAKRLLHGISDATLWRYVQQGILTKKSVGGKIFYSRSQILKLMEG